MKWVEYELKIKKWKIDYKNKFNILITIYKNHNLKLKLLVKYTKLCLYEIIRVMRIAFWILGVQFCLRQALWLQ